MKRFLPLLFILLLAPLVFSSSRRSSVLGVLADHVVISEIQIAGDETTPDDDEFVELYNPTDTAVVMESWKLTRKNSSGTEENLVAEIDGTIPAQGYFLIGHGTGYNGAVSLDVPYSAPSNALTNNYSVLLYDNADVVVDKVGLGSSADPETTAVENPSDNGSVERKAQSDSTSADMEGGAHALLGNGEDTDNNANDFVQRTASDPQNSASAIEEPPAPTDTPTPTPTDTPTPTPTGEPTETPTPTPSESPTPTPTDEPTETPTPTPTATPTPTPELSRTLGVFHFFNKTIICKHVYRPIRFGFFSFFIPHLVCERV